MADKETPHTADQANAPAAEAGAAETRAAESAAAPVAADTAPGEAAGTEAPAKKTLSDLADLADTPAVVEAPAVVEPKIDAQNRSYATGKRKNAIARVWIKPGAGRVTVNGRDQEVYFARPVLRMILQQPFAAADRANQYDVKCTVTGGGLSGQAGAVRHGISKALILYEPALRPALKSGGFLTRDARVVERKKYGKAKARRSFQFSKR